MTPESLRQMIGEFLADSRAAVVLEDRQILFDLTAARYSILGEYNKCLVHFWSSERNLVRRVLDVEVRDGSLRLQVQRMGQNHPSKLEICRECDRRAPSSRRLARTMYENVLRRALQRRFPDWNVVRISTSMDLEHSFGPAYARGLMFRGQSALAVIGVNEQETQPTIDAALTCGILWLDACRHRESGHALVQGLVAVVPRGTGALTAERMVHLHHGAARWQLFEFDEQEGSLEEIDCSDRGNLDSRLVHVVDEKAALERFAQSINLVREILPTCDAVVLSAFEVSFRLRGLEFARARVAHDPRSFRSGQEIVFGVGGEERVLDSENETEFTNLLQLAAAIREKGGPKLHRLWRMHPERWLESEVLRDVAALDGRLCSAFVYSQMPAFSAGDRGIVDILASTRQGRLAVLELKADEDIHLPLQALDYWLRVAFHQQRGEFAYYGYFPGWELAVEKPILFMVAPALHVHPETDKILHYLSPEIEWELLGIDERWREQLRVVFRKHALNHQLTA